MQLNPTQLFVLVTFGAVALGAWWLANLFLQHQDGRLRHRLAAAGEGGVANVKATWKTSLIDLGQWAAQPLMPKNRETQSSLRRQLSQAGLYSATTMRLMIGAKLLLLIAGLAGGYGVGTAMQMKLMGISVGGLAGYMLPTIWLKLAIKRNQKALNHGLPDALDLMVVCVEAGLTLDGAMQRIGDELAIAHPCIAREFGITHMETRVGLSRLESLKNFSQRTGNAAVQSLTSMLAQAERFGTSVAAALRIHAESMRIARQHAAEEMAAKASVKMSFPLVLFIFPATFIVLAGPTVINLMKSSLFQ